MKYLWLIPLLAGLAGAEPAEDHGKHSANLATDQDELAADAQQLAAEQTHEQVIKLLNEVEDLMDEAQERLHQQHTGGETIAIQTEIIEKIHEAAKAKQQQQQGQGQGQGSSGMMQMLERMMGKGGEPKPQAGNQAGEQAGKGMTGDSNSANQAAGGGANGAKNEERRIPKAAGTSGASVPEEFRKALDAYNRGATQRTP